MMLALSSGIEAAETCGVDAAVFKAIRRIASLLSGCIRQVLSPWLLVAWSELEAVVDLVAQLQCHPCKPFRPSFAGAELR